MRHVAERVLLAGVVGGVVAALAVRRRKKERVHEDFPGGYFAVDFEPQATYRQTTPQAELDSRPRGLVVHRGRCHCGAVAFEVDAPSNIVAFDCNCSSCAMRRNTHFVVPKSNLRLLRGSLTCYRFGSGVAQHLFCGVCGISPFYSPRSNPDGYAVTVHCIERGTITSLSVKQFDGVNWEAFIDKSGIRVFSRNRTKT